MTRRAKGREPAPAATVALAAAACLALSAGCFARSEDELDYEGSLTVGQIALHDFPVDATGIRGLGLYCRTMRDCACPILSPGDVEGCREMAWEMDEATCRDILDYDVPECWPEEG